MKLVLSTTAFVLLFLPSAILCAEMPQRYRVLRIAIPETMPMLEESTETSSIAVEPVLRGQSRLSNAVIEELEAPLPPPGNLVNRTIPQDLLAESSDTATVNPADTSQVPVASKPETPKATDKAAGEDWNERLVGTWVMLYAVVATSLFVYFFVVACEYRQRWVTSLTAQNNRLAQSIDAITDGLTPEAAYTAAEPAFALGEADALFGSVRFGES